MTLAALPAGYFAVDDPDRAGRATYWEIDHRGVVRDYAERWRPMPPPGLTRPERRAWYDGPYRQWRAEVERRIAADPAGAAARFRDKYPNPTPLPPGRAPTGWPRQPAKPKRATAADAQTEVRREIQALIVAGLRETGRTYRQISEALDIPASTAYRRAELGRALAAVSDQSLTQQLAGRLTRLGQLDTDGAWAEAAALFAVPSAGDRMALTEKPGPRDAGGTATTS